LLKKILIADDDPVTREMLTRFIVSGSERFEVLSASDEYQALNQLSLKTIDLLIIDLQISHSDEFSLLTLISNEYPNLFIFAVTAFGTPEIQKKIEGIRKCRFFEKPLEMDVITRTISQELFPPRFEGRITGLRFSSFLQLIENEQKSCRLLVRSTDRTGEVCFSHGNIISARTNHLEGTEAVHEINRWNDITIEIPEDGPPCLKKENHPLDSRLSAPINKPEDKKAEQGGLAIDPKPDEKQGQDFSEHYSLTKEFIAQIEQIQSLNIEEQSVSPEKPASGTIIDPVIKMLKMDSNIAAYGIYDSHDVLMAALSESDLFEQCRPSVFYRPALSILGRINSGPFKCMMIKTINFHHILFRYRKKWFWIVVNPDFQIAGLFEKPLQGIAAFEKNQEPECSIRHITRDEKMEKLLEKLNRTEGIMGSYVLSLKKRVIANKMPPVFTGTKLLDIGRLLAKIYLAGKMSIRDISEITLFYQESVITIREISEQMYLVVMYDPAMRMNHLFTSVNMIVTDLKQLADQTAAADSPHAEQKKPAEPETRPSTGIDDFPEIAMDEKDPVIIDPDTLISSGPMAGVLQEMQTALTKVIGPIAPILFTAALKEWIATDQPDFSTIQGLVDILRKEINDPERFDTYRKNITPYIWVNN